MRYLTAIALASAALLVAAGCRERTNMRDLPDRGGHAYRTPSAERPVYAGSKLPYADEQVYTVVAGDNLKKVAGKFGVTEAWLIRRNDLSNNVLEAGSTLIVPKAPATK
jgi:hypothetical protein